MLKADRNAAIRQPRADRRPRSMRRRASIRSGATGRVIRLPSDVRFDAMLAARCNQRPAGPTIRFFASGMSCGGVDRADAARRRLPGARQLADGRCRGCSAQPALGARARAAGFTLIEVLVALAVVAVSLSAIGSLIAATIRGARSVDAHLALIETARAIDDRAAGPRRPSCPATSPASCRAIAGASTCCRSTPTDVDPDPTPLDAADRGGPGAVAVRPDPAAQHRPPAPRADAMSRARAHAARHRGLHAGRGAARDRADGRDPGGDRDRHGAMAAELEPRLRAGAAHRAARARVRAHRRRSGGRGIHHRRPRNIRVPVFDGTELSVTFVRTALGPNTRPGPRARAHRRDRRASRA